MSVERYTQSANAIQFILSFLEMLYSNVVFGGYVVFGGHIPVYICVCVCEHVCNFSNTHSPMGVHT